MKNKFPTFADKIIKQLKDRGYISLVCKKNDQINSCTFWYPSIHKSIPKGFKEDSFAIVALESKDSKNLIIKHFKMEDVIIVSVPHFNYFMEGAEYRKSIRYCFEIADGCLYIHENGLIIHNDPLEKKYKNNLGVYHSEYFFKLMNEIRNSGDYTRSLGVQLACFLYDNKFDFDLQEILNEIEFEELKFLYTAKKFDLSETSDPTNYDKTDLLISKFGYARTCDFEDDIISKMKNIAKVKVINLLISKGRFFFNPLNEVISHYDDKLI